jgi:hypothetical protein
MSENKIRDTLDSLQTSLIELEGKEYYLRSNIGEAAKSIFKVMKIKELPNLIPKNEISDYILTI